jgi:hypothetical protein
MTRITIPAEIMSVVRCAVLAELGNAAAEIEQSSVGCHMEERPEDFGALLGEFDAMRALLHAVGWSNTEQAFDVEEHRRPLNAALESWLRNDRYFVADTATSPAAREETEREIAGLEGVLAAAGLKGGR